MSKIESGNNITNGLVFYIDASNELNYNNYSPFTSSIWYDLSGNAGDLTISSTITATGSGFISDGSGSFIWASGSNTLASAFGVGSSDTALDIFTKGNGSTIEYFIQVTPSTPANTITLGSIIGYGFDPAQTTTAASCSYFVGLTTTTTGWKATIGESSPAADYTISGKTFNTGSWYCVTTIISASAGPPQLYANGIYDSAFPANRNAVAKRGNQIRLGRISVPSNQRGLSNGIKIGSIKVWNRVLSDDEILQSYNTSKGRYGL